MRRSRRGRSATTSRSPAPPRRPRLARDAVDRRALHGVRILPGRGDHRADDVVVARAPAEVALQPLTDLPLGRRRVLGEQADRRHHHARRAEAALQAVLGAERGRDGVQLSNRSATRPSSVVIDPPSACAASSVHDLTDSPSSSTVHAPQDVVSQPMLVALRPRTSRR